MAKPTSLAAQLKRDDEAEKMAQEKEDKEVSARPAADGKVWVRLVRTHYDSNNVIHQPGITQLDADAVPSSAKVLSAVQAKKELDAENGGGSDDE